MEWEFDNSKSIWIQIKEKLIKDIISGKYSPGCPFPTVRDLALEAKVNRNTMQKALSEMEREGLLITNRTAGRLVTDDEKLIKEKREEMVYKLVIQFLNEMKNLGSYEKEIVEIIEKELK